LAEPLITASKITKDFQGVTALADVDVRLDRGSVHGIVGPNGAGKTTLLNVLSGFVRPTSGRVEIEGRDVTRLSPQRRVPLGVMRTFQNIRLFGGLTVLENVLVGQHTHSRTGFTSLVPVRGQRERELRKNAEHALEVFELTAYRKRRAASLPYGVQKQVEMARAMAARPKAMLLDEPAAGMNAEGRQVLVGRINQMRDEGLSIFVVEHDMDIIAKVCDVVTVLNFGTKLLDGTPDVVLSSDLVRAAYLGT
jgi:branched-chain amino acid transport system ATP-binding protein